MEPTVPGSPEEQLNELRARIRDLEESVHEHQLILQKYLPRQDVKQAPATNIPPPVAATLTIPSAPHRSASVEGSNDRSLESRIGSQWFNRIGILAVLIGMAWFLKLAIDNHWVGPLGRVLIGLLAGAGMIAWSEHFQRRKYTAFAYSLKAIGSGILYLSLWAAFSLFHLFPASVAFAAMILITAFNAFMSWLQDAELLAVYSVVGGLSTPLLLSTGVNHEVSLFSYLLLLDMAVLVLVALRPWSRLLAGAFAGTAFFFLGWWFQYYTDAQSGRTVFFLVCFFLLFALAPRLIRTTFKEGRQSAHWDWLSLAFTPLANAALTFGGLYSICYEAQAQWMHPWLAVAFAAFYLVLFRLPAWGLLQSSPALLSSVHLATAVVFLTIAIPLKVHGRWLTIGWLVEGAALLWVSSRQRSSLLRGLSIVCLSIGLFALVFVNPPVSTTPLWNQRFATYCVAIAVFAFTAWTAAHETEPAGFRPSPGASELGLISVLIINALILLALGWEIHNYWWLVRWHGSLKRMQDYRMYAQFTYSALFMCFGAVLLCVGFWRRSAFIRWQALVLVSVSIGKVFLVDVSALSEGYRILSFLGLGALLLAVSFVYQRDWLHLRQIEAKQGHS